MLNDKKLNLTITINKEIHDELFWLVPQGEVSKFVCQLIKKELDRIKKEISIEYKQAAEDQDLINQTKNWYISRLKKIENGKKRN